MKQFKLTAFIFLLTIPFSIYAAPPSNGFSIKPSNVGNIDQINIVKGEIIINDMQMLLSKTAKVHNPDKKFSSSRDLRQGMNIKFNSTIMDKKRMITEVWVLPDN